MSLAAMEALRNAAHARVAFAFLALLAPGPAAASGPAPLAASEALAADDECREGPDGEVCSLSAVQLRGGYVTSAPGYAYLPRTAVADEGTQVEARDGQDVAACEDLCTAKSTCQSFTYGWDGGKCFLKDKHVTARTAATGNAWTNEHFVTYFRVERPRGYIVRPLVANEGKQLSARDGSDLASCAAACDDTRGCQSFTFGADEGKCFLKDKRISRGDPQSSNMWSLKQFVTVYKTGHLQDTKPAPEAPVQQHQHQHQNQQQTSQNFKLAMSCDPETIIRSADTCRKAATELGIPNSRPRVVPPQESTLPPGCMKGPKLDKLAAGMWFNQLGLQAFKPSAGEKVQGEEGFELICKLHPYVKLPKGADCQKDAAIDSLEECKRAAVWLHMAPPKPVPQSAMWTSPQGCIFSPDKDRGLWFNSAPMSFGGDASGLERLCRTD